MAFNAPSKALLYNEFAKLLKAGFGIDKAADTVLSGKPPPEHREFSEVLNRGLGEGKSIAGAVADVALPVSEVEKRLIAAGEKGGRLEAAFAHLAGYFQSVDQTARQVRSGLVYPLVLVHLAVIFAHFPADVLPKRKFGRCFRGDFSETGGRLRDRHSRFFRLENGFSDGPGERWLGSLFEPRPTPGESAAVHRLCPVLSSVRDLFAGRSQDGRERPGRLRRLHAG